ncbi:MAG: hypothetical protein ACTHMR_10125 [Thermomicrobiales bacterium]
MKSSPPTDLRRLTDAQLASHTDGLYARLDTGYAACDQAPDDATRHKWEHAWLALLGQYEAGVIEARRRGLPVRRRVA